MPSAKVNKWIFGTALTAVISLPLIIPGCTPISGPDPIANMFGIGGFGTGGDMNPNAIIGQTMVQPILDMVNQEADLNGKTPTLEEIIAMRGGNSTQTGTLTSATPIYTINEDHIDLTLKGNSQPFCKIFIEGNHAVLKC